MEQGRDWSTGRVWRYNHERPNMASVATPLISGWPRQRSASWQLQASAARLELYCFVKKKFLENILIRNIHILYRHVHPKSEARSRDANKARPEWFTHERCFRDLIASIFGNGDGRLTLLQPAVKKGVTVCCRQVVGWQ
jgi:hypothetical protein